MHSRVAKSARIETFELISCFVFEKILSLFHSHNFTEHSQRALRRREPSKGNLFFKEAWKRASSCMSLHHPSFNASPFIALSLYTFRRNFASKKTSSQQQVRFSFQLFHCLEWCSLAVAKTSGNRPLVNKRWMQRLFMTRPKHAWPCYIDNLLSDRPQLNRRAYAAEQRTNSYIWTTGK